MNALTRYIQTIRDRVTPVQGTHRPGMAEFQLCLKTALGGAVLVGAVGGLVGYPVVACGFLGFLVCGAAARQGVMDARARELRELGARVDQLGAARGAK